MNVSSSDVKHKKNVVALRRAIELWRQRELDAALAVGIRVRDACLTAQATRLGVSPIPNFHERVLLRQAISLRSITLFNAGDIQIANACVSQGWLSRGRRSSEFVPTTAGRQIVKFVRGLM